MKTEQQFTPHQIEHGFVLALLSSDPQSLIEDYQTDALAQMTDEEYALMMERVAERVWPCEVR